MHDWAAILSAILDGYALPVRGDHGVVHWARVQENGLRIAEVNGADREVVKLFALFHNSRRVNEYTDPGHGLRGGEFARSLRGRLVHLDDARFDLLFEACRLHTDGYTTGHPTLLACWDADRLDLGRVGITRRRPCCAPTRLANSWSGLTSGRTRGICRWKSWRRGAWADSEPCKSHGLGDSRCRGPEARAE